MGGDKIRPHDAIAVQKDAVGAASRQNRPVADFRRTKAAVLLPDMLEPMSDFRLPGFDQRRRSPARSVVGHHHLEVPIGLAGERAQHRIERILAVIGSDDHAHEISHGAVSPAKLSCTCNKCLPRLLPPAGSPGGRRESRRATNKRAEKTTIRA